MIEKYSPVEQGELNDSRKKTEKRAEEVSKQSSKPLDYLKDPAGRNLRSRGVKDMDKDQILMRMAEYENKIRKYAKYEKFTKVAPARVEGIFNGKKIVVEYISHGGKYEGTIDGAPMKRAKEFYDDLDSGINLLESCKQQLKQLEGSDEDVLLYQLMKE